jgi:signal transduction histidine kinase
MRITLQRALLFFLVGVLALALIPAGLMLDRRLESDLEARSRTELAMALPVFEDRNSTRADALMMHAKEVAAAPNVAAGLRSVDPQRAIDAAMAARVSPDEHVILVDLEGDSWTALRADPALVEATRGGQMPVAFVEVDSIPWVMSLAPVMDADTWIGAAGVAVPFDDAAAATLAGLTHSDVIVQARGRVPVATLDPEVAGWLVTAVDTDSGDTGSDGVREVSGNDGARYWVIDAALDEAGRVVFVKNVADELALLPRLRLGVVGAAAIALFLVLVLGSLAASAVARPVRELAAASERLAEGDFGAPLPSTSIREVQQVSDTFGGMRQALQARLMQLEEANLELEAKQQKLQTLQGELIQRDRLATSGRMVAELAHEIRNPVAAIRNCLEVVDRRLGDDSEGHEFAQMAIEELMRLHSISEQVLDLNRPADPRDTSCDAAAVARRVADLVALGAADDRWPVSVADEGAPPAVIGPDALKQVLLNAVQNAQEAMLGGGPIHITVRGDHDRVTILVADRGAGIPDDVLPRVFDPFFTTKGEVSGVGLGLFVAHGIVRRHGGRARATNRGDGPGAELAIELPAAAEPAIQ